MTQPQHIPLHLRHVRDFQQNPDGSVSFLDERNNPRNLFGDQARISLGPAEARATFDPQYRRFNLEQALRDQYKSDREVPKTFAQNLTHGIGRGLRKAFDYGTASNDRARATTGALAALAGGALGASLSQENKIRNGILAALLAGGAGYAASALSKQAASIPVKDIMEMIRQSSEINRDHRAIFEGKVRTSSASELADLSRIIRAANGAGLGFILAKFFNIPWLIPSAMGGLIGFNIPKKRRLNAFGQPLIL